MNETRKESQLHPARRSKRPTVATPTRVTATFVQQKQACSYFFSRRAQGKQPTAIIPPRITTAPLGVAWGNRPQGIPVFFIPLHLAFSRFGFGGMFVLV